MNSAFTAITLVCQPCEPVVRTTGPFTVEILHSNNENTCHETPH